MYYRDIHGFIVMCDLTDEVSMRQLPDWLDEISERANIMDHTILILANKCDQVNQIDQQVAVEVEQKLQERFPEVTYKEISVQCAWELEDSVKELADMLMRNKQSYIAQNCS